MDEYRVLQVKGDAGEMTAALQAACRERWQVAPGGCAFPAPGLMVALLRRPATAAQAVAEEAARQVEAEREHNPLTDVDGDYVRMPGRCEQCSRFATVGADRRCDLCAGRTG